MPNSMPIILDGKKLSTELAGELAQEISTLVAGKDGEKGIHPSSLSKSAIIRSQTPI